MVGCFAIAVLIEPLTIFPFTPSFINSHLSVIEPEIAGYVGITFGEFFRS